MRKIQFRGKSLNNGKWAYGDLFHIDNKTAICPTDDINWMDGSELESSKWCWVNPDTVGQFTGLLDKNGKEIYEGDIAKFDSGGEAIISYSQIDAGFIFNYLDMSMPISVMYVINEPVLFDMEVIGNIHDNPEMLK